VAWVGYKRIFFFSIKEYNIIMYICSLLNKCNSMKMNVIPNFTPVYSKSTGIYFGCVVNHKHTENGILYLARKVQSDTSKKERWLHENLIKTNDEHKEN
jgi:hypothetical protein